MFYEWHCTECNKEDNGSDTSACGAEDRKSSQDVHYLHFLGFRVGWSTMNCFLCLSTHSILNRKSIHEHVICSFMLQSLLTILAKGLGILLYAHLVF